MFSGDLFLSKKEAKKAKKADKLLFYSLIIITLVVFGGFILRFWGIVRRRDFFEKD